MGRRDEKCRGVCEQFSKRIADRIAGAMANEGTSVKIARETSLVSSTLPSRRSTAANLVSSLNAAGRERRKLTEASLAEDRPVSRAKGHRSLYHWSNVETFLRNCREYFSGKLPDTPLFPLCSTPA